MLIEFRIQTDDNGGVNVVDAQANPNPNLPAQKHLGAVFGVNPAAPPGKAQPGGDAPVGDIGAGKPPVVPPSSSSGSGTVFVIGPIVICGSGPGHTGAGGDAPVGDIGAGKSNGGAPPPAQNDNPAPADDTYPPKRRQARKKR